LDDFWKLKFYNVIIKDYYNSFIKCDRWDVLVDDYKDYLNIYCDGSNKKYESILSDKFATTSYAVYACLNNVELEYFKDYEVLSNFTDINYGELYSIYMGVSKIKNWLNDNDYNTDCINVISDSLYCINVINKIFNCCDNNFKLYDIGQHDMFSIDQAILESLINDSFIFFNVFDLFF